MSGEGTPRKSQAPTGLLWLIGAALFALVLGGIYLAESLLSEGYQRSDITLRIVRPEDGDTVTSPFILEVESEGIEIAPPEDGVEGAAHYHAIIDTEPFTPGGERIPPESDSVNHFETRGLQLDLPPGEHTIVVILGDNDEIRLPDAPAVAIDVTVEEGAAP